MYKLGGEFHIHIHLQPINSKIKITVFLAMNLTILLKIVFPNIEKSLLKSTIFQNLNYLSYVKKSYDSRFALNIHSKNFSDVIHSIFLAKSMLTFCNLSKLSLTLNAIHFHIHNEF